MENDEKPNVVNPKPEDQKHSENTTEYSKPHTSKAEPEEHVDQLAFGKDGKRDPEHDVDHIKDDGAKEMGQETYEHHQRNKDK